MCIYIYIYISRIVGFYEQNLAFARTIVRNCMQAVVDVVDVYPLVVNNSVS